MIIDEPNISIEKKTNEQNLASVKAWAASITDQLMILSQRIDTIEAKMKGE